MVSACQRASRLPRAHQLFAKTNQFNLTVRRLSLPELERLAGDPSSVLGLAAARDRFGDLGTVGAFLLVRAADGALELDSFLLSCRALGRGVESAMMNEVKRIFLMDGLTGGLGAGPGFDVTPTAVGDHGESADHGVASWSLCPGRTGRRSDPAVGATGL